MSKYNTPITNLNLCLIGCVSSGKSTLLNALFCEELTQTKIKRTTMVPCIFVENKSNNFIDVKNINKRIQEKNTNLIKKSEENKNINKEDYEPLYFDVGNLNINVGCNVTIYDIPGLNDARTKHIYYNYLEENFINFNIIIFIIDINSGLNTNDEIEILRFIIYWTKKITDKNIHTLVVINKADDMTLKNDELEITGELNEMFEQVKTTVLSEFFENNIADKLIGIIPICALDAFLYRMIMSKGNSYKLKPEIILKIGINEMGKKFSKKTSEKQKKEVESIISDKEFIKDMIKLSGFGPLEKKINDFLIMKSPELIIDNLMHKYNQLPELKNMILNNDDSFVNIIMDYQQLLESIKLYNQLKYNELREFIINDIHAGIQKFINQENNTDNILSFYNQIVEALSNTFLNDVFQKDNYYNYVINRIHTIIHDELVYGMNIDINHFMKQFNYLMFIKAEKELLINCILSITTKSINIKLIKFSEYKQNELVLFLENLKEYIQPNNKLIKKLTKFFLLILIENNYTDDELCNLYYYCKLYNEIYISSYLLKKINFTFQNIINEFDNQKINMIESYYIEIIDVE
jgi:GTPase Era involved in 16S rRNA processing